MDCCWRGIFDNGKVVFFKVSTVREDIENAYVLDKIISLMDKGTSVKQYHLPINTRQVQTDNNQLAYLKTVDPKSSNVCSWHHTRERYLGHGNSSLTHSIWFSPLPNRFSNSQDSWGLLNAADNGQYLTFFNYDNNNINRQVNENASMAGILNKFTYPTGGSVEFTYEHN